MLSVLKNREIFITQSICTELSSFSLPLLSRPSAFLLRVLYITTPITMLSVPVVPQLSVCFAIPLFPFVRKQQSLAHCPRNMQLCGNSSEKYISSSQDRTSRTKSHHLSKKYPASRDSPPPQRAHHYINLTNGLESLQSISALVGATEVRFTRIQSSHCESGAYDKLLWSLDNDLLLALACGRTCFVHDRASRDRQRAIPRALFLGLQFVKWAIAYLWFDSTRPELVPAKVFVRGKNTVTYWREEVLPYIIKKDTKKRIRYFEPFATEMGTKDVRLLGVYGKPSDVDGCMGVHVKIMRDWLEEKQPAIEYDGDELRSWMDANKYAIQDNHSTEDELVAIQQWMCNDEDVR